VLEIPCQSDKILSRTDNIISDNDRVREIAESLNDEETGCSAPVAVNATIDGETLSVRAMIGYPDGTHILHKTLSAPLNESDILGDQLAQAMIEEGALDILEQAEKIAFKDEMPQRL